MPPPSQTHHRLAVQQAQGPRPLQSPPAPTTPGSGPSGDHQTRRPRGLCSPGAPIPSTRGAGPRPPLSSAPGAPGAVPPAPLTAPPASAPPGNDAKEAIKAEQNGNRCRRPLADTPTGGPRTRGRGKGRGFGKRGVVIDPLTNPAGAGSDLRGGATAPLTVLFGAGSQRH